ncbi:hypothetical protein QJS10_CPB18g00905 [Acorus calamus]|uniref:Uncharacterized protein n=1 Tax=Acorus calamus TaxID=4465 RepID=A0AAV9CNS8_ACOCL|nr:hypothetical protein QJS10_CPB18g00905 [Acorus calamus]
MSVEPTVTITGFGCKGNHWNSVSKAQISEEMKRSSIKEKMHLKKSFDSGKCKTSLKLALARIKLLKNKRDAQLKVMRRDLSKLLETNQRQTALIRKAFKAIREGQN